MAIWNLNAIDDETYRPGEFCQFIISAPTEYDARQLAQEEATSFPPIYSHRTPLDWTNSDHVDCREVIDNGEPKIVYGYFQPDYLELWELVGSGRLWGRVGTNEN